MNAATLGGFRQTVRRLGALAALGALLVVDPSLQCPAATLGSLLAGGSITAAGARFTDWQLVSLHDSDGASGDFELIQVNPLVNDPGNPGLSFTAAGQLAVSGFNEIDCSLRFRVEALPGSNSFTAHSLTITGISFGADSGIAFISDAADAISGAELPSTVAITNNISDIHQLHSTASFPPQGGLVIETNVFLTGLTNLDSINLTSFTQRFAQNGPPLLAGDYNLDGTVDAADYVAWRRNGGPQAGFAIWRANFGNSASGAGARAASAVPEPPAWLAVLALWLAMCTLRARPIGLRAPFGYHCRVV